MSVSTKSLFIPSVGLLFILITACNDDSKQSQPDAAELANDAPAIEWSVWGEACTRPSYGATTCEGTDGSGGLCVFDWTAHTTCRHYCFSNPPYRSECPADAIAIHDGYYGQGCYCAKLPL